MFYLTYINRGIEIEVWRLLLLESFFLDSTLWSRCACCVALEWVRRLLCNFNQRFWIEILWKRTRMIRSKSLKARTCNIPFVVSCVFSLGLTSKSGNELLACVFKGDCCWSLRWWQRTNFRWIWKKLKESLNGSSTKKWCKVKAATQTFFNRNLALKVIF